jgi:uncharacterized protein
MLRVLLLVGLAWVIWLVWRKSQARDQSAAPPAQSTAAGAEAMRQCAECGVHLPDSQALPGRGGHFCSPEHRQRHEARSPQ